MSRLIIGPFNRVEGDLEVQLEMQDNMIARAFVNAPMYRGFENMLIGRDVMDALTIVPRICGICSVSQSVAAARAIADAAGVSSPANGLLATNLMLACENLADHLTHFYVFFMPDFTRACYGSRPWFAQAQQRFAVIGGGHSSNFGAAGRAVLAARTRWFELMGTLGGKWPHTGSIVPGGSSRALDRDECLRLLAKVREMRGFLESTVFGTTLEEMASLSSVQELRRWEDRSPNSDLALFLRISADLDLDSLGRGPGRFLSYGAYTKGGGEPALAAGLWSDGTVLPVPMDRITEDMRHAWLVEGANGQPLSPAQGITVPHIDKPGAYTWNKAPRLAGQVIETGALARQMVDGQPLIRDAVANVGSTVMTRVLARMLEVARVLPLMEHWLKSIVPLEPFFTAHTLPEHATGVGLTEAARGALGHWLRVEKGRIAHYQIIAPTSWNFSPRDSTGTPGALESALQGVTLEGDVADYQGSARVQHIVRSFDPCMVCTVH